MLEKIMSLISGEVKDKVSSDSRIPEDKKEEAVEATTGSIIDSLKSYLTPDNISMVTSLFGGSGSPSASTGIGKSMQDNVITTLMQKVGLSSAAASGIASSVIPAILSLFKNKVDDNDDPGFNIGSLISSFSGKSADGGGIMDMVGNLFGKK